MNKHTTKRPKQRYRVKNWHEYNEALVKRGALDVWLDPAAEAAWYALPSHAPGAQPVYSDVAISTVLTMRQLFHLPLRATEGFVGSVFRLSRTRLAVPNFSTLSRRGRFLPVKLPKRRKDKTIMVVDSTGVKVYGEGEWKVRQHGASKRRTWKKIHIAVDEHGEIRGVEVTGNAADDASVAPALLDQETASIEAVVGDGGYDRSKVYAACSKAEVAHIIIPPQRNAKIWQHGNTKAPPHPRDENLRLIRRTSRKRWKKTSGYHIRSMAETAMFRLKTIFGDRLHSREWSRQVTELKLACAALNRMFFLGRPQSYVTA